MNKWECNHKGCDSVAIGTGGAIGLRAIGWFFEKGPVLYCPRHRPDPTLHRSHLHKVLFELNYVSDTHEVCSQCTADLEASRWQTIMRLVEGDTIAEYDLEDLNTWSKHVKCLEQ